MRSFIYEGCVFRNFKLINFENFWLNKFNCGMFVYF